MNKPKKPKAFIISLKRCKERREHAIAEAEKAGLDWEIIDAVDARAFRNPDGTTDWDALRKVQDWDNSNWGCQFKASEIAIYGSHLKCYQRMVNLDIDECFIFEDDWELKPCEFGLHEVASDLESLAFDHVLLHHECLDFNSAYKVIGQDGLSPCGPRLHRVQQTGLIGVAYAMYAEFAEYFLTNHSIMRSPHDHQMCALSGDDVFRFYQTVKPVCGSHGFPTTQE